MTYQMPLPDPVDTNQYQPTTFYYQEVSDTKPEQPTFLDLLRFDDELFDSKSFNASSDKSALRVKFDQLVSEWKMRTLLTSSISEKVSDPSYMRIIGMGEDAIPLIIEKLKSQPDHYFVALISIAGVDPVSDEDKGNLEKMANTWIDWWEGS